MTKALFNKFLLASIICLLTHSSVNGQTDEKNPYASLPFKERLFYGGDLGFSFGSNVTYIRVAPLIGYNINPKLSVGVSPSYEYYSNANYVPEYKSTMFGGSAFARYFVLPSIFLQASPEVLNLDAYPVLTPTGDWIYNDNRVTIPVLLLGGGFSQRTPNGSGFFVSLLYDVIQDINSPYPNNIVIRIGGMIAF